jgi:hypothetical protein
MCARAFSAIRNSRATLWGGMVVVPAHQAACDRAARHHGVQKSVRPDFRRNQRAVICHRHDRDDGGRLLLPAPAQLPFTWSQSAKNALAIDGLDKSRG